MKPEGIAALMVHNILWLTNLQTIDVDAGDDRDDFNSAFQCATDDGDEIRGVMLDLDPTEKAVLLAVSLEYAVEAARCLHTLPSGRPPDRSAGQIHTGSGSVATRRSALDLAVVGPVTALVSSDDPVVAAVLQVAAIVSGLCWDIGSLAGTLEPAREALCVVEAGHARQRPPRPAPGPLGTFPSDEEPPF